MSASITVINGSPRENGNSDILLDRFIKGAVEAGCVVKYFKLREKKIAECEGCCKCKTDAECSIDDDMTLIREQAELSDILVFSSPVYWCEITGLLKMCIDRFYFYHHPENSSRISGKKALIISVMGEKNVFYETEVMVSFFNRFLFSLGLDLIDMQFYGGLMEKGDVLNEPVYLDRAYKTGKNLASVI